MEHQHWGEDAPQSAVFDDLHNDEREMYDYGVRKIRNALFFAGAIMLLADVIALISMVYQVPGVRLLLGFGIALAILGFFVGLGFWAKKKPFTALLAGLAVFAALQALAMLGNPASIFQGLLVKAVVVISLAFWLKQARRLQGMKQTIGY